MTIYIASANDQPSKYLAHHGVKGMEKGKRRYQYEDGTYTPLGRIHYGIGLKLKRRKDKKEEKKINEELESMRKWSNGAQDAVESETKKIEKRNADLAKSPNSVTSKIKKPFYEYANKINQENIDQAIKDHEGTEHEIAKAENRLAEIKSERDRKLSRAVTAKDSEVLATARDLERQRTHDARVAAREQKLEQRHLNDVFKTEQKNLRNLSDKDLQTMITRLQQESQASRLLNERHDRERGELKSTVSKILKNAGEDLAKKSLTALTDKAVDKMKDKLNDKDKFKLSKYKNVDIYSLDTEKMKQVSEAFKIAAQIARDRYATDHNGRNPNGKDNDEQQPNNGGDNNQPNQPQNNTNDTQTNQPNQPSNNENNKKKKKNKNRNRNQNPQPNSQPSNSGNQSNRQSSAPQVTTRQDHIQMQAMSRRGLTVSEIADRMGVSEETVRRYIQTGINSRRGRR